jgi:hypothetical protein
LSISIQALLYNTKLVTFLLSKKIRGKKSNFTAAESAIMFIQKKTNVSAADVDDFYTLNTNEIIDLIIELNLENVFFSLSESPHLSLSLTHTHTIYYGMAQCQYSIV